MSGVGVLDKAVTILAACVDGASLAELVDRTKLPRATAHRLAQALEIHRMLVRDAQGRWRPGPRLGELANAAPDILLTAAGVEGRVRVAGRGVVVLGREGEIGAPHRPPGHPQAVERLRARDLVQQVQVDVEQVGLAVGLPNHVSVPNLLRERARGLVSRHLDILKFGR